MSAELSAERDEGWRLMSLQIVLQRTNRPICLVDLRADRLVY